jgi:hypothetical protein
MKTLRIALLLGLLLLHATMFSAVLTGPIYNPATTHSYYLISSNVWGAAEAEAVSLGGHLVTINDAAENAWVLSTFGDLNGIKSPLFLGFNDEASEGNYVWTSGDAVTYQNWNAGEPNNGGGFFPHENHAAMLGLSLSPSDVWNDVADEDVYLGVVEVGETQDCAAELAAANQKIHDLTLPLEVLTAEFRLKFKDPHFQIRGETDVEKMQNLIGAILDLPKGQQQKIYRDLDCR